jgi:hypothetical protein
MGSGLSPLAANTVCGTVDNTLTAAGTTNADALALSAIINNVTTTASGTGVKLMPAEVGASVVVSNQGANALLVYPFASGQINALTVTTGGFSVGAGKTVILFGVSGTNWVTNLSA